VFLRLLVIGVCLFSAAPAFAQIYSWRDADGKLVLSDRPQTDQGGKATYTVHGSSNVHTTTPLAAASKSSRYDALIHRHAQQHGVSADLVRAVIHVESGFNPTAVSVKGAIGLMQLMPATARDLGVTNPFSPEENIRGGVAYLKQLLDRYRGDVELALAAYNAGMGNVEKYGDVPPFKETQNYIKKVTGSRPVPSPNAIYKWVEIVNGRPVIKLSNTPPPTGAYEIVGRQ
jgi:soluble lytic murein transglycosylase-like protein